MNFFWRLFRKKQTIDESKLTADQVAQEKQKRARKSRSELDDVKELPSELYLRLVGFYNTIPQAIKIDPKYADSAVKFEELRNFIDNQLHSDDVKNFLNVDMGDYVHNLNLLLVGIFSVYHLEANIWNIREEYRSHVDDKTYQEFINSPAHDFLLKNKYDSLTDDKQKDLYESRLRFEYKNLVNEIRRARLYEKHVEDTRGYLRDKVRRSYFQLLIAPFIFVLSFLCCIYCSSKFNCCHFPLQSSISKSWSNSYCGLVLIACAAIAGATGSLISVLQRLFGLKDGNQLAQNIVALKYSEKAIQFAPLTGFVFAIVLSFIFNSHLIAGQLFPKMDGWLSTLTDENELTKLLVWCFIAGFSERFVPDMIDNLAEKAEKAEKSGKS